MPGYSARNGEPVAAAGKAAFVVTPQCGQVQARRRWAFGDRPNRRQIDGIILSDHMTRDISRKQLAAARASVGAMINRLVRVIAKPAELTLVARPGAARFGVLAPFLVVARRRLR